MSACSKSLAAAVEAVVGMSRAASPCTCAVVMLAGRRGANATLDAYLQPAREMARVRSRYSCCRYGRRGRARKRLRLGVRSSATQGAQREPWSRVLYQTQVDRDAYQPPKGCVGEACWVENWLDSEPSRDGDGMDDEDREETAAAILEMVSDITAASQCHALLVASMPPSLYSSSHGWRHALDMCRRITLQLRHCATI